MSMHKHLTPVSETKFVVMMRLKKLDQRELLYFEVLHVDGHITPVVTINIADVSLCGFGATKCTATRVRALWLVSSSAYPEPVTEKESTWERCLGA